jgi:hypothetical protein
MVLSAVHDVDSPSSGNIEDAVQPGGATGDGGDCDSNSTAKSGHLEAMVAMQLQKYAVDGHTACAEEPLITIKPATVVDLLIVW